MALGFIPLSDDFIVNSTTLSNQTETSVTGRDGGGYIITWQDSSATGGDTSVDAIRAQMFTADGTPLNSEFVVNTTTVNSQSDPRITLLSNGGFVIVWEDSSVTSGDTSSSAIRGQMFHADGTFNGTEFVVPSTTVQTQAEPEITALENGGFVVTWKDFSGSGLDESSYAVRARVFDSAGDPVGNDFEVNTTVSGSQAAPSIASLSGGGFVVVWEDNSQSGGDTSGYAIRAQMFTSTGVASGSEFLVNTTTSNWQTEPTVTGLNNGGFVITWADSSALAGDTSNNAIRAQAYDAAGSAVGGEFLVNTHTLSNQQDPAIASLADGGYVIAWESYSQDGSGIGVYAQRFNVDGDTVGGEYLVNTTTGNNQSNVAISATSDGGFVVTWESYGQDGDSNGIAARAFAAQSFGSSSRDRLIGDSGDNFLYGLSGNDTLKGRSGEDSLDGGGGKDKLFGGSGADTIAGGQGRDTISGDKGGDTLRGGKGNDIIFGGTGADTMTGGDGVDAFVFNDSDIGTGKLDVITDFSSSLDYLDFTNISYSFAFIGTDEFSIGAGAEVRYLVRENGIKIQVDVDGDGEVDMKILLEDATTLTGSDMFFGE